MHIFHIGHVVGTVVQWGHVEQCVHYTLKVCWCQVEAKQHVAPAVQYVLSDHPRVLLDMSWYWYIVEPSFHVKH